MSFAEGAFTNYYPQTSFITSLDQARNIIVGVESVADCTIYVANFGLTPVTGTLKLIY